MTPEAANPAPLPARSATETGAASKGRIVTIAASIMCRDGMILCADTEETITDDYKGDASKITVFFHHAKLRGEVEFASRIQGGSPNGPQQTGSNALIGVAGAGHSDWIAAFIQGMSDSVISEMDGKKLEWDRTTRLLTTYTEQFFQRYIRGYADDPSHRPQIQIVVVLQTRKRTERDVFRINDNVVIYDHWDECVAVGKGAPAFLHLSKRLLRGYYSMRQASCLAVYIMKTVKSEVPGCGGNSHIVLLGAKGTIETLTTRQILELEVRQAEIEIKWYDGLAAKLIRAGAKP